MSRDLFAAQPGRSETDDSDRPLLRSALVLVDVQRGFDEPYWGRRNRTDCEENVGALLDAFRRARRPVVFVRHDSRLRASPLHPDAPGNALAATLTGTPDLLVTKSVNSAFYGTPDLHEWLRARALSTIVIAGMTTNHCCETTARMGGNLGYDVRFVLDATLAFDRVGPDGVTVPAETIAQVTAANLHGEFATVSTTRDVVDALERASAGA